MIFQNEIADLIKFAQADYASFTRPANKIGRDIYGSYEPLELKLTAIDNRKYIKIVEGPDGGRRVWGFISKGLDGKFKAGDLLKAANWNAPALNFARGTVTDPSTWKTVRWTGIL